MTEDRGGAISTFTTREVANLLDSSPEQVRRLARSEFVQADRGPDGRFIFSFQDVSLLRTALELASASIPARRIRVALTELRRQLPADQPLSAIAVAVDGDEVLARDDRTVWNPESGQTHFDFVAGRVVASPSTLDIAPATGAPNPGNDAPETERDADEWYRFGCSLEESDAPEAEAAFRRAVKCDPGHGDAHLALGYLLHESGRVDEAALHYRLAADADPRDGLAAFNLGVALEDLGKPAEAMRAYRRALEADPDLADAHFNLGRLCEEAGERAAAFEHLRRYKRLTES